MNAIAKGACARGRALALAAAVLALALAGPCGCAMPADGGAGGDAVGGAVGAAAVQDERLPLQADALLALDQGSIDATLASCGFEGFTIGNADSTGDAPVEWDTFAYSADGCDASGASPSPDGARLYVRYAKGADPYGSLPDDVYWSADDLAEGSEPASLAMTVEFDLSADADVDAVMGELFDAVAGDAEPLYTTNISQYFADQAAEAAAKMTEEEREQYEEAVAALGAAPVPEGGYQSGWTDQHWYRCQVRGRDALVRVTAGKIRRYGDDYRALVDAGGARWQVSVYCGYLDVAAAHLGIDATYDAFVAKVQEAGLVNL